MNTESYTKKDKVFQISQERIEKAKDWIRKYKPYALDDPELQIYDNPRLDENRLKATNAMDMLQQLGIDISDVMAKWETE